MFIVTQFPKHRNLKDLYAAQVIYLVKNNNKKITLRSE